MNQTLTLSARLPVLGSRSWTLPLPPSAVLADVIGASVKAAVSVKESPDGIVLALSAAMPWGPEALSEDIPLAGLERGAIDELLSLDGGEFDCSVAVSENL